MEQIISNELLSEVLYNVLIKHNPKYTLVEAVGFDSSINLTHINYKTREGHILFYGINIHELAHLCKEQLISNQLCVTSGNGMLKDSGFFCSIDGFMPMEEMIFYADTEPEAIFQAAQWILDNRT